MVAEVTGRESGSGFFQPVSEGGALREATRRVEVKYAFPGADVGSLRQLLLGSCRRITHRYDVSTVRSVYFDDFRYTACRSNLDGLAKREKLRLRWYDSPMPDGELYFEVKWRQNRVTGKHRQRLILAEPFSSIPYRCLPEALMEALPPELHPFVLRYSHPVVLVEYHREHFVCEDPRYRLTLDYDLKFYDQSGARAPRFRFGFPEQDAVLVEAKAPVGEEGQLSRFLRPLKVRPTRSSKYIRGCLAVGVLAGLG